MRGPYEYRQEDAYRFAEAVGIECWKKGSELHFKYCPYCGGGPHKEKDKFSINLQTGAFNCKRGSCGKRGNMITLAQDFEEFSLGDDGIDDYYRKRNRYRKFEITQLIVNDEAIEYLLGRGISAEVTRRYQVTTPPDKKHTIAFTFFDEYGEAWFIKYRNTAFKKGDKGSKEYCEPKRKPILFGMNHCNFENPTLVMTEGQIDSLSCAEAGIENAVSVPNGKNGFTWYPYCFNFLTRFDELIIFGDYENGEISLLEEMKTRFRGTVKHVRPEDYRDCKDANEILQKYGAEAVRECVNNAVPIDVPWLKRIGDIQRMSLDDIPWIETGIKEIDIKCRLYFGELIILTGAAGEGKSTLATQWALQAAEHGYPTMIYSGEMQSWMVKNWLYLQAAGPHNIDIHDGFKEGVYERIEASEMCKRLYVYDPSDDDETDDQERLVETIIKSIKQYGVRFIVVDNLMTMLDYDGTIETNDAQTVCTRKLAKIAQDHSVIIMLIAHPRKRNGTTFSNDDIAGSSNIANRAHKVIRYSRMTEDFIDVDGKHWSKEDLADAPIRQLTVTKDRLTGETITKGIPMYFNKESKRISAGYKDWSWKMKWEGGDADEFDDADDLGDIPW